jgi:hypothetical protein
MQRALADEREATPLVVAGETRTTSSFAPIRIMVRCTAMSSLGNPEEPDDSDAVNENRQD